MLHRTHVYPDGDRHVSLRVFCPTTGATAAIEKCEACPFASAIVRMGDKDGWVACSPRGHVPNANGRTIPKTVAEVAKNGFISIELSATEETFDALWSNEPIRVLVVVDAQGKSAGWIRPTARHTPSWRSHFNAQTLVTSAVFVEETAPIEMAIRQMATSRLREMIVVNTDQEPVALLTDLDALRFVANR